MRGVISLHNKTPSGTEVSLHVFALGGLNKQVICTVVLDNNILPRDGDNHCREHCELHCGCVVALQREVTVGTTDQHQDRASRGMIHMTRRSGERPKDGAGWQKCGEHNVACASNRARSILGRAIVHREQRG
jgi:hypothetical protein